MHKSTAWILTINCNSGLGAVFGGYILGYMNPSFASVNQVFGIPKESEALIDGIVTSLTPVGAMLGALLSDKYAQSFSPKNSLLVIDVVGILGILLGQIISLNTLYLSRLLLGLTLGINSAIIATYNKSFTPLSLKGIAGALFSVQITGGLFISLVFGFGYANDPDNTFWRTMFLFPIIFPLIRILTLKTVFTQEPPEYLVEQGDLEGVINIQNQKAKEVLSTIFDEQHIKGQITELQIEIQSKQSTLQNYSDLLSPIYRSKLIAGLFSSYLQQASGISAVVFFSTNIFSSVTTNTNIVNTLNVIFGLGNTLISVASGILLFKYGRKELLLKSNIICIGALISLGFFSYLTTVTPSALVQIMSVVPIFVHLIGYNLGLGPVVWLYFAEILPQKGVSLCVAFLWLLASAVGVTFPSMVESLGIHNCFYIFALLGVINHYATNILIKETKDRTAKSIDELFYSKDLLLDKTPVLEMTQISKV